MKKYKVSYTGFAYINAESKEEAEEKFDDDDCVFGELNVESVEEVADFRVRV